MPEMRFAILIPHYDHSTQFVEFWPQLAATGLPVIVVDDGSSVVHLSRLRTLAANESRLRILPISVNEGKGAAVAHGAKWLYAEGFTHCLQIDADGQHALKTMSDMMSAAYKNPDALISGLPQFNSDVPKSRFYGRKISVFWSQVETLSTVIKDPMCGLRIYPLDSLLAMLNDAHIGKRMQFDNEIMVRLYWRGLPIKFVPVEVRYPPNGLSHFQLLNDNIRISLMHTRLFLGMIYRLPALLRRSLSEGS